MSGKSRKSGNNHRKRAAGPRGPKPAPCHELARAKAARAEEDVEHKELLTRHRGEIPIWDLFGLRARRLQAVIEG